MNSANKIIEMPVPRMIRLLCREYYESREKYLGNNTIVRATEIGIDRKSRQDTTSTGLSMTKDHLKKAAKVYFFHENNLSDVSMDALIEAELPRNSVSYRSRRSKLREWQADFQRELIGAGYKMLSPTNQNHWFPNFFESVVTNHDYQAHLYNIRIDIMRRLVEDPNLSDEARSQRDVEVLELKKSFTDHKQAYIDKIQDTISTLDDAGVHELEFSNYASEKSRTDLKNLLSNTQAQEVFDQKDMIEEILNALYWQYSRFEKARFWRCLWTKDTCISFYYQFRHVLDIEAIRKDNEGMGPWMQETWVRAVGTIWECVLMPRLINSWYEEKMSNLSLYQLPELPKAPYEAVRDIQLPEQYRKGLDSVLVVKEPVGGRHLSRFDRPGAIHNVEFEKLDEDDRATDL